MPTLRFETLELRRLMAIDVQLSADTGVHTDAIRAVLPVGSIFTASSNEAGDKLWKSDSTSEASALSLNTRVLFNSQRQLTVAESRRVGVFREPQHPTICRYSSHCLLYLLVSSLFKPMRRSVCLLNLTRWSCYSY